MLAAKGEPSSSISIVKGQICPVEHHHSYDGGMENNISDRNSVHVVDLKVVNLSVLHDSEGDVIAGAARHIVD